MNGEKRNERKRRGNISQHFLCACESICHHKCNAIHHHIGRVLSSLSLSSPPRHLSHETDVTTPSSIALWTSAGESVSAVSVPPSTHCPHPARREGTGVGWGVKGRLWQEISQHINLKRLKLLMKKYSDFFFFFFFFLICIA